MDDTEELIRRAEKRAEEYGADVIVANRISDVGTGRTRAYIIRKNEVKGFEGTKRELASKIADILAGVLG